MFASNLVISVGRENFIIFINFKRYFFQLPDYAFHSWATSSWARYIYQIRKHSRDFIISIRNFLFRHIFTAPTAITSVS
jgi:hypothetical protein